MGSMKSISKRWHYSGTKASKTLHETRDLNKQTNKKIQNKIIKDDCCGVKGWLRGVVVV